VNGPLAESKHAQDNQVGDGHEHEQAQRTAITRLSENLPVNDREKDGNCQADNRRDKQTS
jgi:hypothetical protein